MNLIKKTTILILLISFFGGIMFFSFTAVAYGRTPGVQPTITCPGQPCPPGAICIQNPLCAESFEELINAIINFISWVAVALVPLLIIIAGFYFLTAAGDPAKIQIAKNIILYTCIGLFIILFAKGLIAVIQSVLGVK